MAAHIGGQDGIPPASHQIPASKKESLTSTASTSSTSHIASSRKNKFKKVTEKLIESGIPKGATVPGARILADSYWTEATGLHFTIGGKEYIGNIYPTPLQKYLDAWQEGPPTERPQAKYSFEDYMNSVIIPQLPATELHELQMSCEDIVEYYTDEERSHLQVHFTPDGRLSYSSPCFNEWVDRNNNGMVRTDETYRGFLAGQKALGGETPLRLSKDTNLMFVLGTDGELYTQIKKKGKANHSSLAAGSAVLAAGYINLDRDGKIKEIVFLSGHYQPRAAEAMNVLQLLEKFHVLQDNTKVRLIDENTKDVKIYNAKNWMKP